MCAGALALVATTAWAQTPNADQATRIYNRIAGIPPTAAELAQMVGQSPVAAALIAKHPELLAAPEEELLPSPGTRAARHILDAIREVHHAVETYSAFLPSSLSPGNDNDDDIPF